MNKVGWFKFEPSISKSKMFAHRNLWEKAAGYLGLLASSLLWYASTQIFIVTSFVPHCLSASMFTPKYSHYSYVVTTQRDKGVLQGNNQLMMRIYYP
jgi:hypothetical protein